VFLHYKKLLQIHCLVKRAEEVTYFIQLDLEHMNNSLLHANVFNFFPNEFSYRKIFTLPHFSYVVATIAHPVQTFHAPWF